MAEHARLSNAAHVPPMPVSRLFLFWIYLVNLAFCTAFTLLSPPEGVKSWLFALAVALSYAFIYALPALGLSGLAGWLGRRSPHPTRAALLANLAAWCGASAIQALLLADFIVFKMFGFHINGFVLNLVSTPGGMESMGMDQATQLSFLVMACLPLLVNAGVLAVLWRRKDGTFPGLGRWLTPRRLRAVLLALLLLALGERIAFGISQVQADAGVQTVASHFPAYQPTRFNHLARRLGFEVSRQPSIEMGGRQRSLSYPLRPLQTRTPERLPNIVWLACESLRADMLDPEIMPATSAFAAESLNFTRHYSGGNGTRQGMFSMFYGLPGSYWADMLRQRRAPVLMDRIMELDYELHLSTSAAFSYPEFDKTVFARVPSEQLYADTRGAGWERDRRNVSRMLDWLDQRQHTRPFMLFHFFESAHARYYFPPESVIRKPYLEDFNYATTDVARDIGLIKNRYINSVHHLDQQLGRVLKALSDKGLLENSIVIITGDHGEEFMENGRWGHNSAFTEAQLRVPLVLHVPGQSPARIDQASSHVDLAPTLLGQLGVDAPSSDFSTGQDLLAPRTARPLLFADWNRLAFSDGHYKAVFPLGAGGQLGASATRADDSALDQPFDTTMDALAPSMKYAMEAITRFKTGAAK